MTPPRAAQAAKLAVKPWLHRRMFWAVTIPAIVALSMISSSAVIYVQSLNPRLLVGAERDQAMLAYTLVQEADRDAENFDNLFERNQRFLLADYQLEVFRRFPHTREGWRAVVVLDYYMKAVKQIPDVDTQCAILRTSIDPAKYLTASAVDMTRGTVPFIKCLTRRAEIDLTVRACRNEALSYISLSRPPTDTCVYRWEHPPTERQ